MGTAAEFHRHTGHVNNAHHIGVFLSEHRHSTRSLGLLDRHLLHLQGMSLTDPAIDQGFDLLELIRLHRPRAVEVEAQALEIHQGSGLANPGVHHLLEGRLQQMGGGVIRLGPAPAGPVNLAMHHIANREAAALHPAAVHKHIAVAAHPLDHHDQTVAIGAVAHQHAAIPHLTAAFAVKRRGVEHHLHRITSSGLLGRLTIYNKSLHAAAVLQQFVATEACGLQLGCHLINGILQSEIDAHGSRLGPLTLLLHRRFKAIQINADSMLFGDFLGEFQGEAIGVVKLKSLSA